MELAVVAPVFFVLVMGIFEFGRACMVVELLTEAARRGCRAAIIENTSTATVQSAATDYLTSVGISSENVNVYVNDQLIGSSTDIASYPAYTEMTISVSVPVANVTWVPPWFLSGNLTGVFTMRRE